MLSSSLRGLLAAVFLVTLLATSVAADGVFGQGSSGSLDPGWTEGSQSSLPESETAPGGSLDEVRIARIVGNVGRSRTSEDFFFVAVFGKVDYTANVFPVPPTDIMIEELGNIEFTSDCLGSLPTYLRTHVSQSGDFHAYIPVSPSARALRITLQTFPGAGWEGQPSILDATVTLPAPDTCLMAFDGTASPRPVVDTESVFGQ